jgi:hypothetical protein
MALTMNEHSHTDQPQVTGTGAAAAGAGFLISLSAAVLITFLALGVVDFLASLPMVIAGISVAVFNACASRMINERALSLSADPELIKRVLLLHGLRFLVLITIVLTCVFLLESPHPFLIPLLAAYLMLKFSETLRLYFHHKTRVRTHQ